MKRESFAILANRGPVRVVGIEPRFCGSGNNGQRFLISRIEASSSPCPVLYGRFSRRTGIFFTIFPRFTDLPFDKDALMHMWRFAIITYLRAALAANVLTTDMTRAAFSGLMVSQYERWWNIDIHHFTSKEHFLRYAGRYARRPPISQRRFIRATHTEVVFWTKDLRQKRKVIDRYSIEDFIALLAEHVPDRYEHAIRYFGLLAPGSKKKTSASTFTLLKQKKRPSPRRLSWRASIYKDFGRDPLLDRAGHIMRWTGRRAPVAG